MADAPSYDIAIVGAGAAGLAAAIFAAEAAPQARIVLLERSAKIGAKILISGGGRCNVTNAVVSVEDFNGPRTLIRNVLAAFDEKAAAQWFASLGVPLKQEETGKLFPVSDRARDVVDALLGRCVALRVHIRRNYRVEDVHVAGELKVLRGSGDTIAAPRVILASGGRSLPRTGSDGMGWELVRRLGHSVTPTYPALVPLVLRADFFHAALSGLSQVVELRTFVDGKLADRRRGSLLFTHSGISGPVVLDASRHWVAATWDETIGPGTGASTKGRGEMRCSLVPGESFESLEQGLIQSATSRPRQSVLRWLTAFVSERLGLELLRLAAIDTSTPLAQLGRLPRRALVHVLSDLELPIERARGWDYAEVTAGGVPLSEVNYRTMESRRLTGLYLVGEMLDCDGRIGGFNFQWAWATGCIAGRAAARAA